MTLSIMENHDTIKAALKDYQNTTGEIPKILDRYLEYVARTGKPLFSWDLIGSLIIKKFENVFDDFLIEKPVQCAKTVNSDNTSTYSLKQECLQALKALTGVPFTIQRVCELLLNPKKNYTKLDKFLRGFIRVIKVVTTVDRIGQKITTESQLFANAMSPFEIVNESGDSWSGFSSQSDESLAHIQLHSPPDTNSMITEVKENADYHQEEKKAQSGGTVCLTADSMDTSSSSSSSYSTKMIDQEQQTPENMFSAGGAGGGGGGADQFLFEQKTIISMPPIGALFKPIDQLEAFVQNVSNQVESSSTTKLDESKKRSADESIDSLSEMGSENSIDDNYVTMNQAKKRKVDIVVPVSSQESTISSSDVSISDSDDNDNDVTVAKETGDCSNSEMGGGEVSIEAIPTMSSQATICAEEPSSTNELSKPDESHQGTVAMIISTTTTTTNEESYQTVDAGNSSHNQSVEADQSNCACEDDDDNNNIDQVPVGGDGEAAMEQITVNNSNEESAPSSCEKESNSIDEETGEHV